MNITCQINNSGSWTDISDYVIDGTGKIPYIERNDDYSPVASTFDLCITSTLDISVVRGSQFRFYVDSTIVFAGYADTVNYNYAEKYYTIQLVNDLNKLSSLKLDYDTLNALITDTTDLWKYNASNSNVNMLWVMQCCFQAAGLTLDVSEVASKVFYPGYFGEFESFTKDVTINKFAIDIVILYCCGIPAAGEHGVIDREEYNSKITLFEFISFIFSVFRFTISITDVNSYKLHYETDTYTTSIWGDANVANSTYTINDDDKFEYSIETKLKEYNDAYIAINLPDPGESRVRTYLDMNLKIFYTALAEGSGGTYNTGDHGAYTTFPLIEYCWPRSYDEVNGRYWPPAAPDLSDGLGKVEWMDNLALQIYKKGYQTINDPNGNPIQVPGPWEPIIYGLIWGGTTGYETPELYMNRMGNALKIRLTRDKQIENITTYITTERKGVLKNLIDIKNLTSEIEQEIYL